MGWTIEYWDGASWQTLAGTLDKIVEELNGHKEATFTLPNNATNRNIVASDRDIRISYDGTEIFRGVLSAVKYSQGLLECTAYDKCIATMQTRVIEGTQTWENTPANEILLNICNAAGVVPGSCPATQVSVRFDYTICLDAAIFLADVLNADWWTDLDDSGNPRFNIGSRGTDKGTITVISISRRGIDRSKKIDRVIIRGVDKDGNPIYGEAGSGNNVAVFTEKKASDKATLDSLAAKKLAELNKESSGVSLTVPITEGYNLFPGDTITVINEQLNLSGSYRIWKITKKLGECEVEIDRPEAILEKFLEQTRRYEDLGIYPISSSQLDNPPGPPSAPTGLIATPEAGAIRLTWNANTEADLEGYIIYRDTSSPASTEYARMSSTVFLDTNVAEGETYYYRIKAYDRVGNLSDFSSEVSASPEPEVNLDNPPGPPAAPTGLVAIPGIKGIILEWTPNTEADLDYYIVYRGTSPSPTSEYARTAATMFVDNNVDYGTTYYYRLKAVDRVGNESNFSAEVSASPVQVDSPDIAPDAITAEKILDGAVTDTKLASGAVTLTKFASGIRPVQIVNSLPSLPDPDYPQGAVVFLTTENKLYRSTGNEWTAAVPTLDLVGQITETQISDEAVTTPKLAANAVVADKIAANAVTSDKIAANAVTAGKIAAGAVSTDELAAGAVTADKIQAGAVTASKLAVAQIFIDGLTFTDNSPSSGYVSWSACTVYYQGTAYSISSGNTNKKYIYWNVGDTTFTASDTKPAWAENRFIIAINENGVHTTVWNATLIHGGSIITGTITAQEIKSRSITADRIATNTITSNEVLNIGADKIVISGSVYLSNWRHPSDVTKIDGGQIFTSSITADKLTFPAFNKSTDTLDDVADGTTYRRVKSAALSADGFVLLSKTLKDGRWYDESGVIIDANSGIQIYGGAGTMAFTTRATKDGEIQCYIGTDGKFYAGGGNVKLDREGLKITGNYLIFYEPAGIVRGRIRGITGGDIISDYLSIIGQDNLVLSGGLGAIYIVSDLLPLSDGVQNLGSTTRRFYEIRGANIYGDEIRAALKFKLPVRTYDPSDAEDGEMWLRSDL